MFLKQYKSRDPQHYFIWCWHVEVGKYLAFNSNPGIWIKTIVWFWCSATNIVVVLFLKRPNCSFSKLITDRLKSRFVLLAIDEIRTFCSRFTSTCTYIALLDFKGQQKYSYVKMYYKLYHSKDNGITQVMTVQESGYHHSVNGYCHSKCLAGGWESLHCSRVWVNCLIIWRNIVLYMYNMGTLTMPVVCARTDITVVDISSNCSCKKIFNVLFVPHSKHLWYNFWN